jgi:hypothetical protein
MNITNNISLHDSNNLSQKDTSILSFCNFFNHSNFNLLPKTRINITIPNGNSEKPHVRPYLFPYMWSVKHTHGVLGCRNRTVRSKTTAADKNNNCNNSNNDYNCNRNMNDYCDYNRNNNNNHNNRYKRYTKHTSHISTCTYSLLPTNSVGLGLKDFLRKPLRMCLAVSLLTTVSCNRSYVYRVEYHDGSVEYFDTAPDNAPETKETVKETKRIRTDEIHKYENTK